MPKHKRFFKIWKFNLLCKGIFTVWPIICEKRASSTKCIWTYINDLHSFSSSMTSGIFIFLPVENKTWKCYSCDLCNLNMCHVLTKSVQWLFHWCLIVCNLLLYEIFKVIHYSCNLCQRWFFWSGNFYYHKLDILGPNLKTAWWKLNFFWITFFISLYLTNSIEIFQKSLLYTH